MSVVVEGLSKSFGGAAPALDHVSLTVDHGAFVALLGPSGSGKTTLLRIIAGLEGADCGRLTIDGRDAVQLSPRDRRIGFVFQNYALFRHMSVADNIAFGLSVRPSADRPSQTEIDRRVQELLDMMQLSGLGKRFPKQLSGGQQQRVALARALAIEPSVLLLDEPFGALDAKVRADLRIWLRDLHDRLGLTTIFVTHDQEEALHLADQVAILRQGRIEQIDTPEAVYDQPATPFVAGFLGTANRFEVMLRQGIAYLHDGRPLPITADKLAGYPDGPALIYARPHDVEIVDADGLAATILAISAVGPRRDLDMALNGVADAPQIRVELSRQALSNGGYSRGQTIMVRLRHGFVYPQVPQ